MIRSEFIFMRENGTIRAFDVSPLLDVVLGEGWDIYFWRNKFWQPVRAALGMPETFLDAALSYERQVVEVVVEYSFENIPLSELLIRANGEGGTDYLQGLLDGPPGPPPLSVLIPSARILDVRPSVMEVSL